MFPMSHNKETSRRTAILLYMLHGILVILLNDNSSLNGRCVDPMTMKYPTMKWNVVYCLLALSPTIAEDLAQNGFYDGMPPPRYKSASNSGSESHFRTRISQTILREEVGDDLICAGGIWLEFAISICLKFLVGFETHSSIQNMSSIWLDVGLVANRCWKDAASGRLNNSWAISSAHNEVVLAARSKSDRVWCERMTLITYLMNKTGALTAAALRFKEPIENNSITAMGQM